MPRLPFARPAVPHDGELSVQIKISARHGHLNEAAQVFIQEKAKKLTRLFERLTMIEVTVDMHNGTSAVEFVVQAEHKHDFVAREKAAELVPAVDLAMAKIEGQLRRYKEKIQDHRRRLSTGEVAGPPSEGSTQE